MSNIPSNSPLLSFSSNKGRTPYFAVYIAGVRVPCESVSVTQGTWQFPQATITVPPDEELFALGRNDRAHVVIFYLDQYYDSDAPKYRLLFDGEIIGWTYQKDASSKSIVFNATCFTFVLTQFYLNLAYNIESYATALMQPTQSSASTSFFGLENILPFSFFTKGLDGASSFESPFEYIAHAFKIVNGEVKNANGSTLGSTLLNTFFTTYINTYKLIERTSPFQRVDSADGTGFSLIDGISKGAFQEYMNKTNKMIASVLESGSVYDLLANIYKMMYHELYLFTNPKDGGIPKDIMSKPQCYFTAVPRCNVVFPSMTSMRSMSEDYMSAPTRTYVCQEPTIFQMSQYRNAAYVHAMAKAYYTKAAPAELDMVSKAGAEAEGMSSATTRSFADILVAHETAKGPVIQNTSPGWLYRFLAERFLEEKNQQSSAQPTPDVDPMQLYAYYIHEKTVAESRNGVVMTAFNPYMLHSFSCLIFDTLDDKGHMSGNINSITHVLSQSSSSTQITVSGFSVLNPDGSTVDEPFMPNLDIITNPGSADSIFGEQFGYARLGKGQYRKPTYKVTPLGTTEIEESTQLPLLSAVYHPGDILGKGSTLARNTLTDLGTRCYESFDFAIEQYCSRPITSMDTYLAVFGGTKRVIEVAPNSFFYPPDEIITSDGDEGKPWSRKGSEYVNWRTRVRKVAKKARAHGRFFYGNGQ